MHALLNTEKGIIHETLAACSLLVTLFIIADVDAQNLNLIFKDLKQQNLISV